MTFRLLPVLSAIVLASCASSEPQNVSYAPMAGSAPSMQAEPVVSPSVSVSHGMPTEPATTSLAASPVAASSQPDSPEVSPVDGSMPDSPAAPFVYEQVPANEADIAAGVPAGATNCSTVDGVTLCDAPFDPVVDATQHTN